MKWVKVAIGAVIAISVIPIIALSVFNLTQGKVREEVVTFEILTETTVTTGTYSDLIKYLNNSVISEIKLNNNLLYIDDNNDIEILSDNISFVIVEHTDIDGVFISVMYDDTFGSPDYEFQVNNTVEITFEVTTPPAVSGVTATLLALTPLIFVGGVLSYFLVKTNLKKED